MIVFFENRVHRLPINTTPGPSPGMDFSCRPGVVSYLRIGKVQRMTLSPGNICDVIINDISGVTRHIKFIFGIRMTD